MPRRRNVKLLNSGVTRIESNLVDLCQPKRQESAYETLSVSVANVLEKAQKIMPAAKGPGTRNIFTNIKFASNGKGSLANSSMGQESQKSLRSQFSAASLPGRKSNLTAKPLPQRDCASQLVEIP